MMEKLGEPVDFDAAPAIIRQLLDEKDELKRKVEGMMPTIEEYNASAQPDRIDGKRQAFSEVLFLFKEE